MSVEVYDTREAAVSWVNASGMNTDRIAPVMDRVARELAHWVQSAKRNAPPSIFNRAGYVAPDNPYQQMEVAKKAVEHDDVVGGVADVAGGLIFQGAKWESTNADDADIFNQIARDLNLDGFLRQWFYEDYRYSQAVVGMWWGRRTYKVRGKTEHGNKRKLSRDVATPVALTFLDPTKVVPLKPGAFGQDRLAWHATREEYSAAVASQDGAFGDAVLRDFTIGPIKVSDSEASYLQSIGIDPKRLLGLNPMAVFRICDTKMSYERFPSPRLKSVFPLLDLKQQLIEADRVSLVGAANFILLVRQGTKEDPALPEELDNLRENFKVIAKLPVVIGDHRLNIDIITPDQEYTLDSKKYDTLDQRIMARCLRALSVGTGDRSTATSSLLNRGIAASLETRRHMLKRELEMQIARAIIEHPYNADKFEDEPNLTFMPRRIMIDAEAAISQAVQALRNTKDLSRESTLEFFGFDQAVEALRREFEESSGLDDIFQTEVPFSGSGSDGDPEPSQVSGARGGRPKGGGRSKQSTQGQGARTANGTKSTKE